VDGKTPGNKIQPGLLVPPELPAQLRKNLKGNRAGYIHTPVLERDRAAGRLRLHLSFSPAEPDRHATEARERVASGRPQPRSRGGFVSLDPTARLWFFEASKNNWASS